MTDAFVSSFRTGAVNDTNPPSVVAGSIIPASGSHNYIGEYSDQCYIQQADERINH